MTNLIKLAENVNSNKEILNNMKKLNHYSVEQFVNDAQRYIKAIKEGRVINCIGSVSSSGMSRNIKFLSCEKGKYGFNYLNFTCLFIALGYTEGSKGYGYFRVNGCGMDMIFHTNYSNIHRLSRLGFLNAKQCAELAQKTPTTI